MRRLLALALAVPATVLLSAPPASAGCLEDYADDMSTMSFQELMVVTVSGTDVTIHGSRVIALTGETTTFVNCVV